MLLVCLPLLTMPNPLSCAFSASTARRLVCPSFSFGSLSLALSLLALGSCGKIEDSGQASQPNQAQAGSSAPRRSGGQGDSADVVFARGVQASMDGDSQLAIRLYKSAIEQNPKLTVARFSLGTALVPTASASALGSGTKDPKILAEAIGHLRRVCEDEPENAEYAYWLGRVLDVAGEEAESAEVLTRATELDPEHGKAFKRLGLVHNDLGNHDQALAAWLRAAELLPSDGGVLFNLGNHFLESDLERSSAYYKQSTEVEPTSPKGYLGLSKTLMQLGKQEEAEAAKKLFEVFQAHARNLKRLVSEASKNPKSEEAQFNAAEMYFALGQYESSMAMFSRVLVLNPKDAEAHFYIGTILTKSGALDAALNHFEECVFYEPGIPDSLLALLETCVGLKNELRAEEICEILEPLVETPENHAAFAELLTQLGKAEQANSHAQKAELE